MDVVKQSYVAPLKQKVLLSLEYYRALAILNDQEHRDWELESACYQIRKAAEARDLYAMNQAEANLKDILRRRY